MKTIRCFIENASLASPDNRHVSPIYELSEEGLTFAKHKERKTVKGDDRNLLHSFHVTDENRLTEEETKTIIHVVEAFNAFLTSITVENKNIIISSFVKFYNNSYNKPVSDFSYNVLRNIDKVNYPDYLTFKIDGLSCSVWLSDSSFKFFYPLYDIDVVTPFHDFDDIVRNAPKMVEALNKFDYNLFSRRIDEKKGGFPSTYTVQLNIPYHPRKDLTGIPCWFAFNIYGEQGNYEYLMREKLYDYLKDLGLSDEFIEEHFPDIFKVNEFFVIPEWEDYALPNRVGQGSINSQVNKAFTAPFRIPWFVKTYKDSDAFMKANTYNVPVAYNNLLCRVLNGKWSNSEVADFKEYYHDLITVNSTNPDFARMSLRTQHFLNMLSYYIAISDADTETQLFNNIVRFKESNAENGKFNFNINRRAGITYISIHYDVHRYYLIPRYEYNRIIAEGGK